MRIGVLILRINQKRIDLEAAKVEAEGLEKSLTELKEKKKELEIKQLEVTGKLNEAAKLEKQSGMSSLIQHSSLFELLICFVFINSW